MSSPTIRAQVSKKYFKSLFLNNKNVDIFYTRISAENTLYFVFK